ncbi:unnamed protein product, partial [Larinioides sclopetarius]
CIFTIGRETLKSEDGNLQGNPFAVRDGDIKGDVGAFYGDDYTKHYANQTVAIAGYGRVNKSLYRSKRSKKPEEDEDISISEYYKMRRRPDYEDEDGSRTDNNKTSRPDNDEEDRSITDDNEKRGRPNNDKRERRNNGNRRRNRGNFGGSCQTCGKMIGGGSGYLERVINGRIVKPVYKYPWI